MIWILNAIVAPALLLVDSIAIANVSASVAGTQYIEDHPHPH